ncbi:hypothetical protein QJS10_CPA01g00882 [Acorus calamus]|uniref:Tyrosinase copper-binding domain-containing protein n=1 Tax=Acorus calamus TaxID=4465 RepID=A0AAV9FIQ9_ACOCL|nr:hypothetical protein QJS10_CPA01g00882 [Acorus calamus]
MQIHQQRRRQDPHFPRPSRSTPRPNRRLWRLRSRPTPFHRSPHRGPDPRRLRRRRPPRRRLPHRLLPSPQDLRNRRLRSPSPSSPFRLRRAAHLITDKDYLDKFKLAIFRMKNLPDSDPRSFKNQANVHCAYCDGAYDQVGFPDLELQRILGKLIEDDSFAIPFWNWDHPDGMKMPSIYTDPSSSLFDKLRDAKHQPPTLIDLDYNREDPDYTDKEQIDHNLRIMHRQLVSTARTPELFMGLPYRAGDQPNPGSGSLENVPHGPVHVWTGDRCQPNGENMGTFYAAGRDPIFYAHHANVDRMWDVWKAINKKKHKDFTDKDWLDTSFLFYDENKRPVRVRVRDALEPGVMRYGYEQVPLPWLKTKPLVKLARSTKEARGRKLEEHVEADVAASFPLKLKMAVSVTVKRPKVSRSAAEKEEAEEVLVVDGIEFSRDEYVKIDVYVNSAGHEEKVSPGGRELIGSFVSVPHKHKHDKKEKPITTSLRLGLSEFLEETGAEGDESIVVSLVPRKGKSKIKIGGLKIEVRHIHVDTCSDRSTVSVVLVKHSSTGPLSTLIQTVRRTFVVSVKNTFD